MTCFLVLEVDSLLTPSLPKYLFTVELIFAFFPRRRKGVLQKPDSSRVLPGVSGNIEGMGERLKKF